MTARPAPRHTADCLAQIQQLAKRLRLLEPAVRHQATDTGRDGYSPRSGPSRDYGGRGGHSDPVAALVARRLDARSSDPLVDAHDQMLDKLFRARRLLTQAAEVAAAATPER